MAQDSGVSREKRSESGHGRDDVGGFEMIFGAFWERASAVGGGMFVGGARRFAVAIVATVYVLQWWCSRSRLVNAEVDASKLHWGRRRIAGGMMYLDVCFQRQHDTALLRLRTDDCYG